LRGQTKAESRNDLPGRPAGGGRRVRRGSRRRQIVRKGCVQCDEQAAERGEQFFPHRRSPEAVPWTTTLYLDAQRDAPGRTSLEKIGISWPEHQRQVVNPLSSTDTDIPVHFR
jgi:hypothetical protein